MAEWMYLPDAFRVLVTSPLVWGVVFLGGIIGYTVGVLPGLTGTMAMVLSLGVVYKMPPELGLALVFSILVGSTGAGGVTAALINIPGTPAAAATTLDGYPLSKKGESRQAMGLAIFSSFLGAIISVALILAFLPLMFVVVYKFGDWEIFLFCCFGIFICGSLSGENLVKGWISAILGVFFSLIGIEALQALPRFTFGIHSLQAGLGIIAPLIGLFGLSEIFVVLKDRDITKKSAKAGWMIVDISVFLKNVKNVIRSVLAGIWVGFVPGVGESAACWFSYDLAKRSSKKKEEFGKGSYEGVIAAETANNASTMGALIPLLTLGIPGSGTTAVLLVALLLMNFKPGPTLLMYSPGILCKITIIVFMSAIVLLVCGYIFSKYVIKLLTIPNEILMPLIGALCVLGVWGKEYTKFSLIILLVFGILGFFMKIKNYPVAPMVLGLLIGSIADLHLRRALLQYSQDFLGLFTRPIGIGVIIFLVILSYVSFKSNKEKSINK